jgi:F0F1-type ATP synthase membrane subunit a
MLPLSPEIWGRVRYMAFLGLFVVLLLTYWAYTYTDPNPTSLTPNPHRDLIVLTITLALLLFSLYVYSGINQRKKTEHTNSSQKRLLLVD